MTYLFRFGAISQETFDEKALQYIADVDPVGLLRKCRRRQGDLKTGIRRLNWHIWTACYAGALGIYRQPELFAALLDDDYFKQRTYNADLDDVLRLALLIGTDADAAGPTYKKACAIAGRLQPFFDANVEPMVVLKWIEAAGGLKRLDISDVVVTEEQPDDGDQEVIDSDDDGDDEEDLGLGADDDGSEEIAERNDDEDGFEEDDDDDEEEPAISRLTPRLPARSATNNRRKTASSHSATARKCRTTAKRTEAQPKQAIKTSTHVMRQGNDGMVILEVEVTREMLGKVLNAAHSILFVECTGPEEGWQRVVGVTVTSSD